MLEFIKGLILDLLEWVVMGIVDTSYWICLIGCIVALFLYVGGLKKAGKYIPVSFIIYYLLETLGLAIRSIK
ncbi:hypothetical protein [Clostridium baratii]|uniref:hypothetical protein n=1 Tax=Clostridium baratii TaxID=1561 RepID=UPI003D34FE8E